MPDSLSTSDFQAVISEFIAKMGFTIESSEILDDGSIDFKALTKNPMGGNVLSLIRASAYTKLVKKEDIENLHLKMVDMDAVRAAYITTSGFSEGAVEEAREKPISLINKYQLIDSIEKRGLLEDKGLMRSLESFGMGEKHFQGFDQSFVRAKRREEIRGFFEAKVKKGERASKPRLRYTPLEVFRVVNQKDLFTADDTLRHVETKDYLFINLNNLDLYYIQKKRKRSGTERLLMRSDIIAKIYDLPPSSKENLLNLLDHGDLPLDTIGDKELAILQNKRVIEVYEGKRFKGEVIEYLQLILSGTLETVNLVVSEITAGIGSMGENSPPEKPDIPPVKNVAAQINLPHLTGGKYDIWKYLESMKGIVSFGEIDSMKYTSKEIGTLLTSIFQSKIIPQGIIFMPYYRTKFYDETSHAVTKYEVLFTPKFKTEKKITSVEKEMDTKRVKGGVPKVKGRKPTPSSEFKLIR